MNPYVKILIGLALMAGSVWYVKTTALFEIMTVLKGSVPVMVFMVGLFMVWLELDELRIEGELRRESRKIRRKK